ncbi:hypothetical protein PY650_35600 [Rhizobium calliandrae]|uniref:Uncharacterized protein n=1 Tax=Rhizobium calliandrae TaxID=1312182 RepID=A0ABT7KT23_9HYPH|nr:hypothetical protein [Rhizobium calliandrae]MDL2410779.1 hypothetical protein [Rhizobium calliandrae]
MVAKVLIILLAVYSLRALAKFGFALSYRSRRKALDRASTADDITANSTRNGPIDFIGIRNIFGIWEHHRTAVARRNADV